MKKSNEIKRVRFTPSNLQVREAPEGGTGSGRTITGYAVMFNTPSEVLYDSGSETAREIIRPEAVTPSLLDRCDIHMTMFHDSRLILARSREGSGTLSYSVDDKGVAFSFEAPNTTDGDKALELVRRGDISGCSFMFSTCYGDPQYVERREVKSGSRVDVTYVVRAINKIYDFTLAAHPAYPDTSVSASERELFRDLSRSRREAEQPKRKKKKKNKNTGNNGDQPYEAAVKGMRRIADTYDNKIF